MRVIELAKELGYTDKNAFIELLNGYGVVVTSHLSGLTAEQVEMIREKVNQPQIKNQSIALKKVENDEPYSVKSDIFYRVKSNVFGELIYINHKTKEKTTWSKQGDIQLMSGQDLKDMKAGQISFYENNLIFIIGEESVDIDPMKIYKALMVDKFYRSSINVEDISQIYSLSEEQIKQKISTMSDTAKTNLVVALNENIRSGQLDSFKKIKIFEEALGCDLLRAL